MIFMHPNVLHMGDRSPGCTKELLYVTSSSHFSLIPLPSHFNLNIIIVILKSYENWSFLVLASLLVFGTVWYEVVTFKFKINNDFSERGRGKEGKREEIMVLGWMGEEFWIENSRLANQHDICNKIIFWYLYKRSPIFYLFTNRSLNIW